jgi:hypothetical protein
MSPTAGAQAGRGVAGGGGGELVVDVVAGVLLPDLVAAGIEGALVEVVVTEAEVRGATVEGGRRIDGDVDGGLGGWWMTMEVMNEVNTEVT